MLLDAPCSSTGTIRRHPDVPWLKAEADIADARRRCSSGCSTAPLTLLKPGGTLVYCVCSLEPEEGERADRRACWPATRRRAASRSRPARSFGHAEFITPDGDLRTLPLHLPDPDPRWGGLDGFYAARLVKNA